MSSEVQARGRSSTREPVTTLALGAGAGGGVSSNVWRRESDLDAHRRSTTPSLMHSRALHVSGASHGCPVRRHAHLRPSLSRARIFSYQRRPHEVGIGAKYNGCMTAAALNSDNRLRSTAMVVLPSVVKWTSRDARLSGTSTATIVRGFWSSGKRMFRAKNAASSADVVNNLVSHAPRGQIRHGKPKTSPSMLIMQDLAALPRLVT